jgi:hypothetical protein
VGPASKALSRCSILRRCAAIADLLVACYSLATLLLHYTAKDYWGKAFIHRSTQKVTSQKLLSFRFTRKLSMTGCEVAHSQWFIGSSDQGMRKGRIDTKRAGRHRP